MTPLLLVADDKRMTLWTNVCLQNISDTFNSSDFVLHNTMMTMVGSHNECAESFRIRAISLKKWCPWPQEAR